MMKKSRKFLLCMMMAAVVSAACAESTVPNAAQPLRTADFAHYPSCVQEETSGRWSVQTNQADALVDRFLEYGSRGNAEMCVFHLAVEGDMRTGVWSPVLRIYHMDGRESINATAVSILVDGVRYDLAASAVTVGSGRSMAEKITAPLDHQSLAAVRAMMEGETVSLRLMGDAIYTTTLDRESRQERRIIEASSLDGLAAGMELLQQAGLSAYQLWDLSAEAWKQEYGFEPAFSQSTAEAVIGGEAVEDLFGMVLPDDRGDAAEAAQQVLAERGFLSGIANTFDEKAVRAVRRAQTYLGRIETGCMDAGLEKALAQGRFGQTGTDAEMKTLGSVASIGLNRYWYAEGVSAAAGRESIRTVSNTDHLFLAADGEICNLSQQQLHLFMQLEARVIYNGVCGYEAEIVCECSDGTVLDQVLLPLAKTRVVIYAEIPEALAYDETAEWSIEVTGGGESLVFDLQ